MTVRINANSCKNALGTVFLLATAFFVCSTFISMRSVFADPIAPTNTNVAQSGRQSPRSTTRSTSNRTVSRATTSRGTVTPTRATVSRGTAANRTVSSRSVTSSKRPVAASRSVASRTRNTNQTSNRSVRARSGRTQSRVSATGDVMSSGNRAGTTTMVSYLQSRLNTGYSNIVDSTTGMISAEAYANCMDSYYACMDEICTARNETRGRCSCAGRATNFIEAEEALERANEELIVLSGQLALLVATKGKGDDLSAAFSLTEAEQVMNCVSWRDTAAKCQTGNYEDDNSGYDIMQQWYISHPTYENAQSVNVITEASCNNLIEPYYCKTDGNNFGFDITDINGSSSDILAQLKSWAEAKEQAKVVLKNDESNLGVKTTAIAKIVKKLSNDVSDIDESKKDNMSKKWGYKLFEYAHNNVCGRVLDSCFNGIWEGCGTPPKVVDSDKNTHNKCGNGATSSCPFNYNSYIAVNTDVNSGKYGDIILNERGSRSDNNTDASCFGYTTVTTSTGSTRTVSSDPYRSLRGPVADARRSIMQKYLLDANAACDVYGAALKNTAQNINYQKVAAEQALQQKRLEFRQQEESSTQSNYATYASNFVSCMDELYDCYTNYSTEGWTTARVKTYCAQKSQVPSCYEPMVCSPSHLALKAVIDKPDNPDKDGKCLFAQDFRDNTCRNVVTISEILYGANSNQETLEGYSTLKYDQYYDSAKLRESCLREAGVRNIRTWSIGQANVYECSYAELAAKDPNASAGYKTTNSGGAECEYITDCKSGFQLYGGECVRQTKACDIADMPEHAAEAAYVLEPDNDGEWHWTEQCIISRCVSGYHIENNECIANTRGCTSTDTNATETEERWNGYNWGNKCIITACNDGFHVDTVRNQCAETIE